MTWIKICGTTNLEDAQLAVEAGADALGFVFYEKSARNIDPATAREIVAALPPNVEKVGVFVEQTVEQIARICAHAALSAVQVCADFNGVGTTRILDLTRQHNYRLFFTLPATTLDDGIFFSNDFRKQVAAVLLDSATAEHLGGTGKVFDWEKAYGMVQGLSLTIPVIIAGGLTPLNVGKAVKLFQPYGVDVASGVEAKPGKKDSQKVRAFVQAVRAAEKNN